MATGRIRTWLLVGCVTVPGTCVVAFACFFSFALVAHWRHHEWWQLVDDRILTLAERRPAGVSPSQWAFCVHWTGKLHDNFGSYEYFELSYRDKFLAEFDRRLRGKVDVRTIDWIWDEYVEHSKYAGDFSLEYRPTTREHLRELSEGKWGHYDLEDDLERLRRRRGGER